MNGLRSFFLIIVLGIGPDEFLGLPGPSDFDCVHAGPFGILHGGGVDRAAAALVCC